MEGKGKAKYGERKAYDLFTHLHAHYIHENKIYRYPLSSCYKLYHFIYRFPGRATDFSSTVDDLRLAADTNNREMTLAQERMAFLERTLHTVR